MKTRSLAPVLALSLLVAGCSSNSADPTPSFTSESEHVEAFCNLVAEGRALETELDINGLAVQMQLAVSNATTDDDPAAIAAIRAWGAALDSGGTGIVLIYEDLLETIDDPILERGIGVSIDLNRDFSASFGEALSSVETLTELTNIMTQLNEDMLAVMSDPDDMEAVIYLDQYSQDNCGFPISIT